MAKGDALAIMLGGKAGGDMGPMPDTGDEMSADEAAFEGAAIAAMEAYEAQDMSGFALNLKDANEICFEKKMAGEEDY